VVVTVVFMIPVAFMDSPALLVVVVVRMAPVRTLIGRPLPDSTLHSYLPPFQAQNPPNIARTWHGSLDLIPQRWRSTTDINAESRPLDGETCMCFNWQSPTLPSDSSAMMAMMAMVTMARFCKCSSR
jgi:hypothetical protein